ncbi:hypothetical protein HDU98_003814, partial [Podochytrium sp. JEL0797]
MQTSEHQQKQKEIARQQWLRELDEQRKQNAVAKKRDHDERKERVLVYSSLFESPTHQPILSDPHPKPPTETSFFTGGKQIPEPSAAPPPSVTGRRRRTLSEIKAMSSMSSLVQQPPLAPPKNPSKQKQPILEYASLTDQLESSQSVTHQSLNAASYGRIRSQFAKDQPASEDSTQKLKTAQEEWRDSLKLQIEEKKRRDEAERNKPEFVYRSWGETQHPGNHGGGGGGGGIDASITGSVRRSARVIEAESHAGLDSSAANGNSAPSVAKASPKPAPEPNHLAPAAETPTLTPKPPKPPLMSKLPRPTPVKLAALKQPTPTPILQPQPAESLNSKPAPHLPRSPTKKLAKIIQTVSALKLQSPSPPPPQFEPHPPPMNKRHNPSLSPTRKLSKILGSVKSSQGYPLVEDKVGVLRGAIRDAGESKPKHEPKVRVRSAFGRSLPEKPPPLVPVGTKNRTASNLANKLPTLGRGSVVQQSKEAESKFHQHQSRIHQRVKEEKQQLSYQQEELLLQQQRERTPSHRVQEGLVERVYGESPVPVGKFTKAAIQAA